MAGSLAFLTLCLTCGTSAGDEAIPEALDADDQCTLPDCGVNALQLRSRSSHGTLSLPFGYTVLGPGREVVARVLLPLEMPCPNQLRITLQDQVQVVPVDLRAEPLVGLHGVWYTDGERFQHLTKINYTDGNPATPFTYNDRVCEARFVPNFLGQGLVAKFHLHNNETLEVPMPSRSPQRYFVLGDTGLRVEAMNDGWCAEERR